MSTQGLAWKHYAFVWIHDCVVEGMKEAGLLPNSPEAMGTVVPEAPPHHHLDGSGADNVIAVQCISAARGGDDLSA